MVKYQEGDRGMGLTEIMFLNKYPEIAGEINGKTTTFDLGFMIARVEEAGIPIAENVCLATIAHEGYRTYKLVAAHEHNRVDRSDISDTDEFGLTDGQLEGWKVADAFE